MHQILIRPLEINDSAISYQWRNNPEIWEFTGSRPDRIITREIEKEWLENALNNHTSKRFAIICNDIYIGNVQLTGITEDHAEFHIFIGEKDFWGKGISQLATYQILYYAKEVLKLTSIQLSVNKNNQSALKSYQNNNFKIIDENDEMIKMSIDLKVLKTPMVSVFVMVYNHEAFLKECLDGILMQKCNFNFDIVVGEDFSTDNSRNILLNYQKKYPGKFKLLLHEQNIGAVANQNEVFKACTGKYIALCEGDDYWTDPLKLQKQVDFLEKNEEYGLVCTQCNATGENRKPLSENREITPYEILHHNPISTLTTLFRKDSLDTIKINHKTVMGDYPLWLEFAKRTKIMKLKDNTAFYRVLENSASGRNNLDRRINFMKDNNYITNYYINSFNFTKKQKHEILIARFSILMAAIARKNKLNQFSALLNFSLKIKHFDFKLFKQAIASLINYKS